MNHDQYTPIATKTSNTDTRVRPTATYSGVKPSSQYDAGPSVALRHVCVCVCVCIQPLTSLGSGTLAHLVHG